MDLQFKSAKEIACGFNCFSEPVCTAGVLAPRRIVGHRTFAGPPGQLRAIQIGTKTALIAHRGPRAESAGVLLGVSKTA
jgi:hypothetical protein